MASLSVIVITKNEAHNIEACLESVSFADEWVVVDSGSTDNTVELSRKFTDKVLVTDWPGDGPQKNRAIDMTTGDWILCLDADERVTPQLAAEIKQAMQQDSCQGFEIPYISTYCGKAIRWGDWRGEKHLRLFKKSAGQFSNHVVHCRAQVEGKIGLLKHHILHHPFRNMDALLHKLNDYSTGSAVRKFEQGKKATLWTAISHGLWTFIRGYFIKLGLLDGKEGFMLALSNAHGTYYRYVKLMHLSEQRKHHGNAAAHPHVSSGS